MSQMEIEGKTYAEALKEAQELGRVKQESTRRAMALYVDFLMHETLIKKLQIPGILWVLIGMVVLYFFLLG